MRFSIGVPVRTKANGERSDFTRRAVLICQFLMRCASSSTTTSGCNTSLMSGASPFVVHDGEECGFAVGGEARWPIPENGAHRAIGETCNLFLPLRLERGGAH